MTVSALENVDVLNTNIRFYLEQDPTYIELMKNIEKAKEESCEVVIVTPSDVATASNYISNYKRISKNVEALRKNLVQPLTEKKAEIDAFFKSIPLQYEKELDRLEEELLDYKRQQEAKARKEAEAERKRLEEEAIQKGIAEEERRIKEAEAKGVPVENIAPVEPAIVPEVIPQTKKISQMNSSKVSTRKTKSFKVVDEKLIPREYLMVDEQKIRAERMKYDAVNLDGSQVKSTIPGVEFTYSESVV